MIFVLQSERKNFLKILSENGMDVKTACKQAGIPKSSFYRYLDTHPQFKAQVAKVRTKRISPEVRVFSSLIEKAASGHLPSIRLFLDTRYPEKQVHKHYCKRCGNPLSAEDDALFTEFKRLRQTESKERADELFALFRNKKDPN